MKKLALILAVIFGANVLAPVMPESTGFGVPYAEAAKTKKKKKKP